jgi:hypothetical protein
MCIIKIILWIAFVNLYIGRRTMVKFAVCCMWNILGGTRYRSLLKHSAYNPVRFPIVSLQFFIDLTFRLLMSTIVDVPHR